MNLFIIRDDNAEGHPWYRAKSPVGGHMWTSSINNADVYEESEVPLAFKRLAVRVDVVDGMLTIVLPGAIQSMYIEGMVSTLCGTRRPRHVHVSNKVCAPAAIHPRRVGRCRQRHANENAATTRAVRARKKAAKICLCCSLPAKGYPTYSDYCEKHALATKMYIDEYVREWNSDRALKFKAAGVCMRCGNKRYGRRKMCRTCTMYNRAKTKAYYERKRAA